MTKLADVEGIGATYAAKLEAVGITSAKDMLAKGATAKGRKELAEATDISVKRILAWTNRADLSRVKGVGGEYADLLEASGVDTCPELAQRNANNLHAKMAEVNEAKKLVRKMPTASQIEDWVAQAKDLPRIVEY